MEGESKRQRRHDPERKERIISKAFGAIAQYGVAGVTHRNIAELAEVSLGSMTYHFKGMDELLFIVFSRFAEEGAEFVRSRLSGAATPDEAIHILAEALTDGVWANRDNIAVLYEFYSLATRKPLYRPILAAWSETVRQSLERLFTPEEARAFDVCFEGILLQNFLNPSGGLTSSEIVALLKRICLGDG
ncbi:TetR/AcrR family transcriptional regulator [Pseudomonas sp. H11T01]|uniref:TetR/AcrR family transcriptional regulator n=1 Tax=Pseudomonas sp. H11T01 TaxID=3402749 RepID=UPI003ACAA33C